MPLIQVNMLEGRTPEQKKALLTAITTAVHESIGAPLPSIRVWIHELTEDGFMVAGQTAADRKAEAQATSGPSGPSGPNGKEG